MSPSLKSVRTEYRVRPVVAADMVAVMDMFSQCVASDPQYLPGIAVGDREKLLDWFALKHLHAGFAALDHSDLIVGFAGVRDAEPTPAVMPGRWMESCRLAVAPQARGAHTARVLTAASTSYARDAGVTHLWLRCVSGSAAHACYLRDGWQYLAPTRFDDDAAGLGGQDGVTLYRTLAPRPGPVEEFAARSTTQAHRKARR